MILGLWISVLVLIWSALAVFNIDGSGDGNRTTIGAGLIVTAIWVGFTILFFITRHP